MKIKKIIRFIFNRNYRFIILSNQGYYKKMPDDVFLKRKYKAIMDRELNLENPVTFNEKLQWLKLYNRKPEYTMMVDKYKVREYIANKIGEEYLIPLIGAWDDPDEIDFDELPNQFVLKCNHNSGLGMCICKDKSKLDIGKVKSELKKGLAEDFYAVNREWPYKDVPRKIICEKYMVDESGDDLRDYKLLCFNGEPKTTSVCSNRVTISGLCEDFYNGKWKRVEVKRPGNPNSNRSMDKPVNFDLMQTLARKLVKDCPFVRTDFYEINGKVYFGELTFFLASELSEFEPSKWNHIFGDWVELPEGGDFTIDEKFVYLFRKKANNKMRELRDYKFYCFNGKVKLLMIASGRFSAEQTCFDYFDRDFNPVPLEWGNPNSDTLPKRPECFNEMVDLAEKLSSGMPHVRVDLYECRRKVYFGELTFFDGSGFGSFEDIKWDYKLGSWIELPSKNN